MFIGALKYFGNIQTDKQRQTEAGGNIISCLKAC